MATINYQYSKKNSLVTIGVLVISGLLFISNIFKAYYNNDRFDLVAFSILVLVLAFLLVVVVGKRLLPALKDEIVLEFNEKGIIDYLRNITIDWQDIKSIDFKHSRSASMILLQLNWESDYGSQIVISLRWVKGKDLDIYNTAIDYFEKYHDTDTSMA